MIINLVHNDVKKVHRKFPLDICLICLKFFMQYNVIIRTGFRFILVIFKTDKTWDECT